MHLFLFSAFVHCYDRDVDPWPEEWALVGRDQAKHGGPPEARGSGTSGTRPSPDGRGGPSGSRGPVPSSVSPPGTVRLLRTKRVARADPLERQSVRDGRGGPSGSRGPVPSSVSPSGTAAADQAGRAGRPPRASVGLGRPRRVKRVARAGPLERQSVRDGRGGPSGSRGPIPPSVSRSGTAAADSDQAGRAGRLPRASVGPGTVGAPAPPCATASA